jgi:hypothetical protein
MKFSDAVLTKAKGGRIELRAVDSREEYVLCKYLDTKTLRPADKKKKLCLRDKDDSIQEYFIIPLKDKRSLLVASGKKEKNAKVWNERKKKEEDVWK